MPHDAAAPVFCARRPLPWSVKAIPAWRKLTVSLLWPDQVEIFFAPQRVELTRRSRREPRSVHSFDCSPAQEGAPWKPALQTLTDALAKLEWGKARAHAQVRLSNHFMRYALVRTAAKLRT